MPPDFPQIAPFLVAALLVFVLYRRFKRSFGRQLLRPARMAGRTVLLALMGCALLPMAFRSAQFLAAEVLGAALGVALAAWGARRTRFLMDGGRLHYWPHTYTGIAVSLLLVGRLAFRGAQAYTGAHASNPALSSPLTVGIFCVLIGYYVCYYGWVLWKSQRLSAADIEPDPVATVQ